MAAVLGAQNADAKHRLWRVLSLISYSFFIDRDLSKLPPALNDRLAATDDEHRKLLSGVLNFVLSSPEYAPY